MIQPSRKGSPVTQAVFTIHPLDAGRMADLDAVFQARGCAEARRCYCMYYRLAHRDYQPAPGLLLPESNRARMRALAGADRAPGLIGYLDGQAACWISLGPREDFARLATSPTMLRVDDTPVWSIVCFVVPSQHRGQGLAHRMLQEAIRFAAAQGARVLEAYPVDREVPASADAPWFGSLSQFRAAGFEEVARHRPGRPIVRLRLGEADHPPGN
jgi:ribosomal protein S18 acetylase RimI-like enzyme